MIPLLVYADALFMYAVGEGGGGIPAKHASVFGTFLAPLNTGLRQKKKQKKLLVPELQCVVYRVPDVPK